MLSANVTVTPGHEGGVVAVAGSSHGQRMAVGPRGIVGRVTTRFKGTRRVSPVVALPSHDRSEPVAGCDCPSPYDLGVRMDGKALPDLCAEVLDALTRRDDHAYGTAFEALAQRADLADEAELSAAVAVLGSALAGISLGNGGDVARLTGELVYRGGDPTPALAPLALRVADALERAARFVTRWHELGDGELPDPADPDSIPAVLGRLPAAEHGLAEAWFSADPWSSGLLLPLQRPAVRSQLPHRDRLIAVAGAGAEDFGAAFWLQGLLRVLDDEPLVVLHRETGAGYELTLGGVGDNFQLHTLLAATLIGDPAHGLLPGTPPHPAWIAAATDGDPQPANTIHGQFNLVDAHGEWIWNEGVPADIPAVDGRRVVVLDPPPYPRAWNTGRGYPLMRPALTLDRVLPADEAARWLASVAPASVAPVSAPLA